MLKKNWNLIYTFLVFISDYVIINISFIFAVIIRFSTTSQALNYIPLWLFINIIFFPLAIFNGLYRNIFQSPPEVHKHHLKIMSVLYALMVMSFLYIIKGSEYSRVVIISFILIQYLLLYFGRFLLFRLNRFLLKNVIGKKSVIIIGTDYQAGEFYQNLNDYFGDYYSVKGFIKNGIDESVEKEISGKIIGNEENVVSIIKNHHPDCIFIVKNKLYSELSRLIEKIINFSSVPVKLITPHTNKLLSNLKIRDITGVPLSIDKRRYRFIFFRESMKLCIDLVLVFFSGIILLPLGLIIALAIKLTSKGPVFFKQKRSLFEGGKTFTFYKFRTMVEEADQLKKKYKSQNETDGALFKMKDDPRITKLGKFLRRYSLDEIPQVINVLKGDMSIVGPRPLPVEDYDMLNEETVQLDWYKKRGECKPGITGLWQISGRSDLSFEEMCLLDLYYIENQNPIFDLEIIFHTLPIVLFGKGAY